jgi:diguanylate cyclase (GGDEF)-like protein
MKEFFEKQGRVFWAILCMCLVALLDITDYLTGPAFAFSLFYLIPVSLAAWFAGKGSGVAMSVISSCSWLFTEILSGRTSLQPAMYYWETLTRLIFFTTIGQLLSALHKSLLNEKALARIDKVTGSANTRYFYELLEMEITRSARYKDIFSVAYIDFDNFKAVNDRFGHQEGDRALGLFVRTARAHLRAVDSVARLGGDEFAILMPQTAQEQARSVVERIQQGFLAEMQKNSWPVTCSIGVLTCAGAPATVNDVLKQADALMYSVKNSGKNAVRYSLCKP